MQLSLLTETLQSAHERRSENPRAFGLPGLRLEESAPGAADWHPLSEASGRYGTTNDTHVIARKGRPTCRLVDVETGELVATARKSCPLEPTDGSP